MTMHKDIDFRVFAHEAGVVVKYGKDKVIFKEQDPPKSMYIILTGSVEITSHGKVIETINEGKALGFVSILDNRPHVTTARAREDCELAVMNPRKFRYMVDEVPNFGWYVMLELTHRLRKLNAALESNPE
jgi:CRP/FNR family cyclic AMP-dependent transcriptional regulator